MSWEIQQFKDVVQFPPKITLEKGELYSFIPMEDLSSGIKYVSPKIEKVWSGSGGAKFEDGDTLFARITPCLQNGKISQAKNLKNGKGFGSTEYFIFRGIENVSDSDFIYYFSLNEEFKKYAIGSMVGASGRQRADQKFVGEFEINLPPLETQKRIASILSNYDDLIDNNLKRIKLLEETAKNIYKEWFVNFRFPNYEHTEFDAESGLPVGWEILALKDIYDKLESGSRPKGGIDKDLKEGVPSIGAESIRELGYFDFNKTKFISNDFYEKMNKGKIEDRDILIYKDGAYIGKTTLFQDDFPYSNCAVNEHVFLLNTKNKLHQYYLFFTLSTKEYYKKMQNLNSNAAQPGINQPKLLQLELLMSNNEDLLIRFNEKVEPLVKQIYSLAKINKNLKEARDILLPRLMNRTIEV